MDLKLVYIIGAMALVLLFLDRQYRILPMLTYEGYASGRILQRCGVDLAPCSNGYRCMNGFCRSVDQPELLDRNPLPVLP
jgi:hypothetical protein